MKKNEISGFVLGKTVERVQGHLTKDVCYIVTMLLQGHEEEFKFEFLSEHNQHRKENICASSNPVSKKTLLLLTETGHIVSFTIGEEDSFENHTLTTAMRQ